MNQKEMKMNNNKGFSLVELIVVIAIMAVLVGVLAPQFLKYVEKSRESTDIQNIQQIKTVVETHYADIEKDITFSLVLQNGQEATQSGDTEAVLEALGIEKKNAKLKSSKWGKVTLTYKTADNTWTIDYVHGKDASGKSAPFYELSESLGIAKAGAEAAGNP